MKLSAEVQGWTVTVSDSTDIPHIALISLGILVLSQHTGAEKMHYTAVRCYCSKY